MTDGEDPATENAATEDPATEGPATEDPATEDAATEQGEADRPDDPASPADSPAERPSSGSGTAEGVAEGADGVDGAVGVEGVGDERDRDRDDPADGRVAPADRSSAVDPASVPDALVDRVEEAPAEEIAAEIAGLREEVAAETQRAEALRDRLDEHRERADEREDRIETLEEQLKRKQADFQNFKKRNERKLEQELERATEDLVVRLLDVRDNLARGLDQEGDIRDGVESTLRQLDDVLDAEGATRIDPDPGDQIDPESHEVLMQVASSQPEGSVADVHRAGYEMGGKVIRTAQVLVSDGSEHDPDAVGDAEADAVGDAEADAAGDAEADAVGDAEGSR